MEIVHRPPGIAVQARKLLDGPTLEMLEYHVSQNQERYDHKLVFGGKPLHIYGPEGSALHFDECGMLSGCVAAVSWVYRQKIPVAGHRHLPPEFLSNDGYPTVTCIDIEDREIVFGIREALNFSIAYEE